MVLHKKPTRDDVMTSNTAHNFTKEILRQSEGRNPVDNYYDVLLALEILKTEMDNFKNLKNENFIRRPHHDTTKRKTNRHNIKNKRGLGRLG